MRKWIYYCGSWASLIGCLLVASGLESYTGWAMAGCFVGALVLLALAVVLAGLGNCAEQEEDEKPCKERQPQEKRAADRRKAGRRMGRYRVNVECSQKLPQTKSEYFTHCSYEVQAISKGVAKAMVEDKARAEHGGCTCKAYSVEVLK